MDLVTLLQIVILEVANSSIGRERIMNSFLLTPNPVKRERISNYSRQNKPPGSGTWYERWIKCTALRDPPTTCGPFILILLYVAPGFEFDLCKKHPAASDVIKPCHAFSKKPCLFMKTERTVTKSKIPN